ncbi:MAG: hypothetical protein WKF88_02625 [Ferruginibacter sp.]
MKKILILYPHFPPSNLAGVHRPRLFAQHLPAFGWEPVILTVHEDHYEEPADPNLVKLLPKDLRVEKVKAYKRWGPLGDIGLRAFFQLYKKAKEMILEEKFDFLYIPIPSFYCALLGRRLHAATGIPYGIDYIDPWVHRFPGSEKMFSRHWFSTKLAKFLEPIAVKNASLITGVAEGYYRPVLERNPRLKNIVTGAMPYGGEAADHEIISSLNINPYLFRPKNEKLQLVYAGAMLPKAYGPLEEIFRAMSERPDAFNDVEFHFIGTGKKTDDPESYNIKPLAIQYGLWGNIVFEYPARIPYLDVLVHLNIADVAFILGSTEPHYTPSKVYQAILSRKPILAVLHRESSTVKVIEESRAGSVLPFNGENDIRSIYADFPARFLEFRNFVSTFDKARVDTALFSEYSAYAVTKELAELLNKAVG